MMNPIESDILHYLSTERAALFRGTLVGDLVRLHAVLPEVWSDCTEDDVQSAIERLIAAGKIVQDGQRCLRLAVEETKPKDKVTQRGLFE